MATARRELVLAAALVAAACGGDERSIVGPGAPALDAVNGAAFPILMPGQRITIEGSGFGAEQGSGTVVFRGAGGSTPAPRDSTDWSNTHILTVVPDGATSGELEVVTAAGITLRLPAWVAAPPIFDPATLAWTAATPLPIAAAGMSAAAGQQTRGTVLETFVVAIAGGATAGDTTRVYLGTVDPAGAIQSWQRVSSLPAPRTHAAIVLATPHSTRRSTSPALYVAGGISPTGQAIGTVIAARITLSDGAVGEWVPVAALPEGLVAPRATLTHGMIYLTGGADATGLPRAGAYVARVRADGALEGWFRGPDAQTPLAHHGSVGSGRRLWVFGGTASAAPPSGSDTLEQRRDAAENTQLSPTSGYFGTAAWADGGSVFGGGRSRFATLQAGGYVLAVGGFYPGAGMSLAETVAAPLSDSTLGAFAGPVGTSTIAGQGGGVPVDAVGVWWHDLQGAAHGLLLGGTDLTTGNPRASTWRY